MRSRLIRDGGSDHESGTSEHSQRLVRRRLEIAHAASRDGAQILERIPLVHQLPGPGGDRHGAVLRPRPEQLVDAERVAEDAPAARFTVPALRSRKRCGASQAAGYAPGELGLPVEPHAVPCEARIEFGQHPNRHHAGASSA